MRINVKYFGEIAEIIGKSSEMIDFEIEKKTDLKAFFKQKHPEIEEKMYKIAKNQEFCDFLLPEDEHVELALLPPFAGG